MADGTDVEDAAFVRRYLYAGAQHGAGLAQLTDLTLQGTRGANPVNMVDYTPLYRCTLVNLARWVQDGVAPPASAVPRWADGTAARREDVLDQLGSVPTVARPEPGDLPVLQALDLGPHADAGFGRFPARPFGDHYPCAVSAVDADRNEIAGVAMPDVAVPVATHLGFNPRHPDMGAPGQIMEYTGSSVPFTATKTERERCGDPRASLEERYADLNAYEAQVRAAAHRLVRSRHLLADDVELCVKIAAKRYRLVAGGSPAAGPELCEAAVDVGVRREQG